MRPASVILVFLNCLFFNFNSFAQEDYAGFIITLTGDTIIGNFKKSKDVFSEIQFATSNEKMRKYTPNDIKGYAIKYPGILINSCYESLPINEVGNIFALEQFSDNTIKAYYTSFKKEGEKAKKSVNIYILNKEIHKVSYPITSPKITYDQWLEGGVKVAEKDTLQGFIFIPGFWGLGEKKVMFRTKNNTNATTYKYSEINGFFCKDFAYTKIDVAQSEDKEKERMVYEIINGEPMQLYAEEIQKGARVQGMGNVYFVTKFYIKKKGFNEVLVIPGNPPLTKKEDIEAIKKWFKDYPALAVAIISGNLAEYNIIVDLYNIHYTLQNK
jgi:hypothetical protein